MDVTTETFETRRDRALARAAGRRRLLGRLVWPLPHARPCDRSRRSQERDGKLELAKIDVDAEQVLAARYGIQSIPTVAVFRDGEPVTGFVGAHPAARDRQLPRRDDRTTRRRNRGGLTAEPRVFRPRLATRGKHPARPARRLLRERVEAVIARERARLD